MKFSSGILLIFFTGIVSCSAQQKSKVELKSRMDSVAYSIGMNIGQNLKRDSLMLDLDILKSGMNDVIYGNTSLLTDDQVKGVLTAFQQEVSKKQTERMMVVRDANKKKGMAFLEENKKKEGVKVTTSGLQYKVVKEGTGKQPTDKSSVTVHYKGTTLDGKVFDSSVSRGQPATFPLNRVIKGWTEGLQLMVQGERARFWIPGELAYGDKPQRPGAPAGTLVFDVELLDIQ